MEEPKQQQAAPEGQGKAENKHDLATEQPGPAKGRVNNTSDTQPLAKAEPRREERTIEERMSAFERSMVRLTRAAVVVAVITCVIFLGQFYEMYTGSKDTHMLARAAKMQADRAETISASVQKAASALKTANSNAKLAIDAAIGQFRSEQRAWLSVGESVSAIELGKPVTYAISVMNTGRTVARRVIIRTYISFSSQEIPTEARLRENRGTQVNPASIAVIAPSIPSSSQNSVPAEYVPAIEKRLKPKGYIYIWGRLEYYDIFGQRHTTAYCAYHRGMPDGSSLLQCPFHNDAN
jgi:hypothetical protein